jgi:hypothetical protein
MAFDVSTLAAYTKDNWKELVTSSVLGSKTANLIKSQGNVLVGVKSAENITIMDTDAFFQSGTNCGFNASGTTTFTQRAVTVGKIKINEALCLKDLESKFLQNALPQGSRYTDMIFAEQYSNRKAEKVAEQMEIALWQGDTASANGNLNKFDGLLKLITAASTAVTDANTSTYITGGPIASITVANVVSVFDAIYTAIPAKVVAKDDITIFCGMDTFRLYTIALKNANLFAYNLDIKADSEFFLPGTTVKVVAVQGLNGTNDLVAARISNLFMGTDLLNEEERFEIFYAKEADQIRYVNEFKAGVNFAFPDEIVKFFI